MTWTQAFDAARVDAHGRYAGASYAAMLMGVRIIRVALEADPDDPHSLGAVVGILDLLYPTESR